MCRKNIPGEFMLFHTHPLVHLITNQVTMNKTVNGILAAGGRAICADAPAEAEDITGLADALVLNTGMPSEERVRAMRIAGKKANAKGIPVVLDPVGAGASGLRNQILTTLLSEIRFTAIRGNASEIAALCRVSFRSGGVEDVGARASVEAMRELSRRTGAVIIATGEEDIVIRDGDAPGQTLTGGSPLQKQVTGSGCMLSGILGAALADARLKSAADARTACIRHDASIMTASNENTVLFPAADRKKDTLLSDPSDKKGTFPSDRGIANASDADIPGSADKSDFDTAVRLLKLYRRAAADAEAMMRRQGYFGTMSYETFLTDALSRIGRPAWSRHCLSLYAVTDRAWLNGRTLADVTEQALTGGVTMVQLREKMIDPDDFIREAKELVPLCHRFGVPLIINDHPQFCQKAGADGVHLGQDDMSVREARRILGPDAIIGATAHNVEEAVRAESDGADYLGSGAAFGSLTKRNAVRINPEEYRKITSSVHIPVAAIGGIHEDNILKLKGLGLSGVAVVSGIFAAEDIEKAAGRLKHLSTLIQEPPCCV